jgi:hypothetical protein
MKLLAAPLELPVRVTPTSFAAGRLTWPPVEITLREPVWVVVVTPATVVVFSFLVTMGALGLCVIFPPDIRVKLVLVVPPAGAIGALIVSGPAVLLPMVRELEVLDALI